MGNDGRLSGYIVSIEDSKLLRKYFPHSVHGLDGEKCWIHKDWIDEDFPTAKCITSWEIKGRELSIVWAPMRGKYMTLNKKYRRQDGDDSLIEYAPSLSRLRLSTGGEMIGEDLDKFMESMSFVMDRWRLIKKAESSTTEGD